ncbi:MAG: peptide chain release factor N(5)-glutamine methyltransferase [Nitrospirae bacterium]|nr:peptide chain release factor N(5)-glutamine methyltransferase [Nitrospirota bacterium]
MKALDKIKEATAFLKECGIDDAPKESEIILIHILEIDRIILYRDNPNISEDAIKIINEILARRKEREPLQYILGQVEFYGMNIKVGPGVLVPRPETEMIVEEVLKAVSSFKFQVSSENKNLPLNIVDLCTGSGCVALAIAKNLPKSLIYGTDISGKAIGYANENAEINGIGNVRFLKGSLFEPVAGFAPFDIIVSNPPYIRSNDIPDLPPEIKYWEPRSALDGGEDGIKFFGEILQTAPKHLVKGGFLCLELGQGQADAVIMIAQRNGFKNISIKIDCLGIERIISMTK